LKSSVIKKKRAMPVDEQEAATGGAGLPATNHGILPQNMF
jgi:hypothetical protein